MKVFNLDPKKVNFKNACFGLISNLPGAAILNNCDVSWLPYCSDTKSDCSGTIGQPRHVTLGSLRFSTAAATTTAQNHDIIG